MKTLVTRVAVLERQQQPVGCAGCRHWHGTVIVTVDEAGSETGRSRPETCQHCGRMVPMSQVIELVGVDWHDL